MRCHRLVELLGSTPLSVRVGVFCSTTVLPLGSGDICSPTTTSLLSDVPGGSQVMRVAEFVLAVAPSTDTSVGFTIFLSNTW